MHLQLLHRSRQTTPGIIEGTATVYEPIRPTNGPTLTIAYESGYARGYADGRDGEPNAIAAARTNGTPDTPGPKCLEPDCYCNGGDNYPDGSTVSADGGHAKLCDIFTGRECDCEPYAVPDTDFIAHARTCPDDSAPFADDYSHRTIIDGQRCIHYDAESRDGCNANPDTNI